MAPPGLALGTAQLGSPYGITPALVDDATAHAIVTGAIERGIEWVDTAPEYGDAEERLGLILATTPGAAHVAIATRLPALPPGLSSDALARRVGEAVDGSRRRLRRDRLDVYLTHGTGDLACYGAALADALAAQVDAGAVGRVGASVYDPEDARRLMAHAALDAIQFPFNLFDRRMSESGCTQRLVETGCLCFARSALLQGLLTLPANAVPRHLSSAAPWLGALHQALAAAERATVDTALCFAIHESGAERIVIGVDAVSQLDDVVAAREKPLPRPLVATLERVLADVPAEVRDPRRWSGGPRAATPK